MKIGTRDSRLARLQTDQALERLRSLLPGLAFEAEPLSSPGDRDRQTDLRGSPPDFFTRDLDDAVLAGRLDAALHSAKDVPDPVRDGLDWVWLPWKEDPRDALVLAPGRTVADLPASPVIGISSDRRAAWCQARFPGSKPTSIRGTIERRLAQVDDGSYDGVVMAAAALVRLGLDARITEWIPLSESEPPDGQGVLALTFRAGDSRFLKLRSLFVRPVVFVGAGCGAGSCTMDGVAALRRAEVCLHDALLDPALLHHLPAQARILDVGKRAGAHRAGQDDINRQLTDWARRGLRVVRLKGGDPGLFGRLGEEVDALDRLHLPYRVIPGVSSLAAATTGTGLLLTRRGVTTGFTVLTPRREGGATAPVDEAARRPLPLVFFMGIGVLESITADLLAEGRAPETPAAVIFDAGSADETVIRGRLDELPARITDRSRPGLIVIGEPARHGYSPRGPLAGRRVLLPCSEALEAKAADAVRDFGGVPVLLRLFETEPDPAIIPVLRSLRDFDWAAVTSPTAAEQLLLGLKQAEADVRTLPKLLVGGPGTADVFLKSGIRPDLVPERDFGASGLLEAARRVLKAGDRLVRLRSEAAGPELARKLAALGLSVTDAVLYRRRPLPAGPLPAFDAVLFTSSSAVDGLLDREDAIDWPARTVVAIGAPTRQRLEVRYFPNVLVPGQSTAEAAVETLAAAWIRNEMETRS